MSTLVYKSRALIEDLTEGECTLRRCGNGTGARWWNLWWMARRETDGVLEDFEVPVSPGGSFVETGPGGRTWGFTETSQGIWQVSPSINVLVSRVTVAGAHEDVSLWHQTPAVVGVPEGELWIP